MEQDFNSIMQKYKEELLRYDAMQRAAAGNSNMQGIQTQSDSQAQTGSQGTGTQMQSDTGVRSEMQTQPETQAQSDSRRQFEPLTNPQQDYLIDEINEPGQMIADSVRNSNLQSIGMPEGINPSFISQNTRAQQQADALQFGAFSPENARLGEMRQEAVQPGAAQPGTQREAAQPAEGNPNTETGRLIVHVTALGQTTPIPNANVIISQKSAGENDRLIWHGVTDISGNTQLFLLPAPPEANSEQPGLKNPYVVYNVRVVSPGFYSLENLDAQVFSGQTSLLEANMVPLPESDINGDRTITVQTPENNL